VTPGEQGAPGAPGGQGEQREQPSGVSPDRAEQLAGRLAQVRGRIASAAAAAGRPADSVTLVVVTKNWPASDVLELARLGVRDVGENRDQEASAKAAACADARLRWHFVGQLQTNKVRSVAQYAHVVHSVDRPRLVSALETAAQAAGRRLGALVQVSLDGDTTRGGALPADVPALAEELAACEHLALRGVMAVAPVGSPRAAFGVLAKVSADLQRGHPDATWVSAGMSGDLEDAVAAGATHVRVGSAILGARPALR
jgi:PLP dependent protein